MPYFNQCSSKEVIRISGLLRFWKTNTANLDFSLQCGEQSFADADIVEPRYNERLYNKVLDTTNDFLYPNNTDKIYEKNTLLDSDQILSAPWPFVKSRFHCMCS